MIYPKEQPIRISAVSYLNSKPFLFGLETSAIIEQIELSLDIPADCAKKLLTGAVDLGLVPVAVIPQLQEAHLVSDYCIGAEGLVHTVCIYSEVPIEKIEELYLDYQSRTSVALCKLLLKDYWKLNPKFLPSSEGYVENIQSKRAALVIGDRAIGLEKRFPFVYDLSQTWFQHTGLPFVFAAWVSNRKLPDSFIESFNKALKIGLASMEQVAAFYQSQYAGFDVLHYFQQFISYDLNSEKKKALDLFLNQIGS